jgi:hypothetical protein
MPVQPAREGIVENIDPSLLSQPAIPSIGDNMTRLSPCQSFVIDLDGSSSVAGPHEARTVASEHYMIEVGDLRDLGEEKPQALKSGNPSDTAIASGMW